MLAEAMLWMLPHTEDLPSAESDRLRLVESAAAELISYQSQRLKTNVENALFQLDERGTEVKIILTKSKHRSSVQFNGVVVKSILPEGQALKDGRLQIGDRLLKIDGEDMSNATQAAVVPKLRVVPVGKDVELIVWRYEFRPCGLVIHNPLSMTLSEFISHAPQRSAVMSNFCPLGSMDDSHLVAHFKEPRQNIVLLKFTIPLIERSTETTLQETLAFRTMRLGVSVKDSRLIPPSIDRDSKVERAVEELIQRMLQLRRNPKSPNTTLESDFEELLEEEEELVGSEIPQAILNSADSLGGVKVKGIIEGGAAHKDGRLKVGDELLAINDVCLVRALPSPLVALRVALKDAMLEAENDSRDSFVRLVVARSTKLRRSASGHTLASTSEYGPGTGYGDGSTSGSFIKPYYAPNGTLGSDVDASAPGRAGSKMQLESTSKTAQGSGDLSSDHASSSIALTAPLAESSSGPEGIPSRMDAASPLFMEQSTISRKVSADVHRQHNNSASLDRGSGSSSSHNFANDHATGTVIRTNRKPCSAEMFEGKPTRPVFQIPAAKLIKIKGSSVSLPTRNSASSNSSTHSGPPQSAEESQRMSSKRGRSSSSLAYQVVSNSRGQVAVAYPNNGRNSRQKTAYLQTISGTDLFLLCPMNLKGVRAVSLLEEGKVALVRPHSSTAVIGKKQSESIACACHICQFYVFLKCPSEGEIPVLWSCA
ncbi:hypothetical protein Ciccas_000425 [Cichlidogyrus casuarinus]|uniref:PDZ domain-containing protein n=1 Tax=Cichlidogyrus casuarinus TaxID=1844966 RepID=A0ABD2QN33_9PLAT